MPINHDILGPSSPREHWHYQITGLKLKLQILRIQIADWLTGGDYAQLRRARHRLQVCQPRDISQICDFLNNDGVVGEVSDTPSEFQKTEAVRWMYACHQALFSKDCAHD